ncbi:MAG: hypothetical protein L3J43_09575 [Sulfurovum sp.]|nr:hypothetical protein [Sulfurovum sp.]
MKKSKQTQPMEARLFVLIPAENHKAIVICRRSSKKVGVFQWDMLSNKIKVSQWLKGRIYEYFSDVSPDGRHFLYSMNQKGWGYTVISKSPWIKAISIWRNVGGWGGGIFIDNKRYMLYDGYMSYANFVDKSLKCIDRAKFNEGDEKFNNKYNALLEGSLYAQKLIQSGWEKISKADNIEIFQKNMKHNALLEKTVYGYPHGSNLKGKGQFWEMHKIRIGDIVEEKEDWEWCEYMYENIYYVQKGCLYELSSLDNEPTLIYDFNSEEFVERIAPY